MHILLTGGTGFIGTPLAADLREQGHAVSVLTRTARAARDGIVYVTEVAAVLDPIDAVVNLAGASLAERRWSAAYKRELRASRLDTTRALGEALDAAGQRPATFLSASAIGYYGATDAPRTEADGPGLGFAADLCRDWERVAAEAAGEARFCALRLGVVFGRGGGAYEQMARPFRLRFGNWIGNGEQALSWIHLRDTVAAIRFLLERSDLSGPFNLTAPEPTTSRGFCAAMQNEHCSLVSMGLPAPLMRLALGEMADELLIGGQRVLPQRLLDAGFAFSYPTLAEALRDLERAR